MTSTELLTRARRGAAFLDDKLGRGWRRRIKRGKLNMRVGSFPSPYYNGCGCILAQLGGSYEEEAETLGIDPYEKEAFALGFMASDAEFEELTDAWLTVLREGPGAS